MKAQILGSLALLIAMTASAQAGEIPSVQLRDYVGAVRQAAELQNLCANGGARLEFGEVGNVNRGWIEPGGAQPVLTLTIDYDAAAKTDFVVTTSSDYKTVTKIEIERKEFKRVYQSVIPPVYVDQWATVNSVTCN